MSQYLSSIIDPVVRQARRFSRPSSSGDGQPQIHSTHRVTTPVAAIENGETIIGSHDVETQSSLVSSDEDEEPSDEGQTTGNLRIQFAEHANMELPSSSTGSATQSALVNGEEPSNNDMHIPWSSITLDTSSQAPSSRSLMVLDTSPSTVVNQESGGNSNSRDGTICFDKPLPEDDGMGALRRRILAIQRAESSSEIKARLVHAVMTERHDASLQNPPYRAQSPASLRSSETPFTPSSPKSTDSQGQIILAPTSSSSAGDNPNRFHLTAEDLCPTFYEKPSPPAKDMTNDRSSSYSEEEPRALGCAHYKRNIKLQCSACNRWYTCRFCHDAVEDHMLNRRETKNMLCMLCGCAQPASEGCTSCGVRGAWYYCDVCKLWDDDPDPDRGIYHCDDCGICRVGKGLGKDFFHCKKCSACMAIAMQDAHRCIERSTDCDCPICGEYMFTSLRTVVCMLCGHSIHRRCYEEHIKTSYRCPICSRSIANMEWQFTRLRRAIELQPMPEEFRDTKAWVYCNDCVAKTVVKYHWLGLQCGVCDSYNTVQLSLLTAPSSLPSTTTPSSPLPPTEQTVVDPLRPSSRGRVRHHSLPYVQPRAATSLPNSNTLRNPFSASLAFPPLRRDTYSVSPPPMTTFPFSQSFSTSEGEDDEEDEEASMTGSNNSSSDDYSDVDFWGGESPRLLSRSPPNRPDGVGALDEAEDDESGDESEDYDDDADMLDNDNDDDDDDDEAEGDELSRMELFGHR